MTGRLALLRAVFSSPLLRPAEGAYFLFAFGEWSTWVAVIVYAYGRGGALEAGIVAFAELAPSVLLAPAVAGLGDRFARDRVLFATYSAQAALMAATALTVAVGSASLVVYVLAVVTATVVSLSRPIHAAFMPEIARSPDELTAANVVSGMAESGGSLIGPLGAGLLIGIGGPTAVFATASAGCVIASVAILRLGRTIRRSDARPGVRPTSADRDVTGPVTGTVRAGRTDLAGGLLAIVADRRLLSVVVIGAWSTFLVGSMDILYAVLAIDLMDLGGDGVGFVGALGGVGAIVGAIAGLGLVGRERLGDALVGSAALFGLGIAAIGLAPVSIGTLILLVAAGAGSGMTAVATQTLIQRLAGDNVMSRVFGVLQGLMMGTTALGALAVPFLVAAIHERLTFVVAGLSLPIVALLAGWSLVLGERSDPDRAADLRLLRGVPMLGPLSAPVLERLATAAVRSLAPAGTVIVGEGDLGDRFFVIAAGRARVAVHGRQVAEIGPGDGFGEIALLRSVPRTATVAAVDDVEILAIDRRPFIDALTGQARSATIATLTAEDHLAADLARG